MKSKKGLLLNSRLYLILDKDTCPKGNVINIIRALDKHSVDLVQLRQNTACDREFFEDAKSIKRLCQERGIIFLVNNRLDIAELVDSDGVHLGQSDLPVSAARKILGADKIIGLTCRNTVQARNAEAQGADYISIGPIFPTSIKPGLRPIKTKIIKEIDNKLRCPCFVIGGINHSNIKKVASYGAKRFAVCRAVCYAKNEEKAAKELKKLILATS